MAAPVALYTQSTKSRHYFLLHVIAVIGPKVSRVRAVGNFSRQIRRPSFSHFHLTDVKHVERHGYHPCPSTWPLGATSPAPLQKRGRVRINRSSHSIAIRRTLSSSTIISFSINSENVSSVSRSNESSRIFFFAVERQRGRSGASRNLVALPRGQAEGKGRYVVCRCLEKIKAKQKPFTSSAGSLRYVPSYLLQSFA